MKILSRDTSYKLAPAGLSLDHIGKELGQCGSNIDTSCEGTIQTNNVMGYSSHADSFWHWQEEKLIINK